MPDAVLGGVWAVAYYSGPLCTLVDFLAADSLALPPFLILICSSKFSTNA